MRVVVMGVAGSGKSTVGALLAAQLDVPYADADSFHSPANVAKMAAATPLSDSDRWPWLDAIAQWLAAHGGGAVVSCSALRRSYRDVLRTGGEDICFLHLDGSVDVMVARVADRTDHFMPADLVASQFATLERPGPDEQAVSLDASMTPAEIVEQFLRQIGQVETGG